MKTQKNDGANQSIAGSLIAALCIVIYLFALVQGSVRVYYSIEERRVTADREFAEIAETALLASAQGFMNENFVKTMDRALTSSKTLEALIITGANGGHAYEKKPGYAIAWVNNTPRFINRFTFSNQNHYKPLAIQERDANIKAVASILDYSEFSKILKETLLLIMAGLSISFFTFIFQLLSGKQENIKGKMIYVDSPLQSASARQREQDIEEAEISDGSSKSIPKGLYSPRSNIGWEEYTKDRLDSELHRCSSTEKDLALILMEFNEINGDLLFRQAAEEAVSFFTSRDLLFEFGKHGISVILPGIGHDTAITRAEKFYQRIMEKFSGNSISYSLNIGLSSRSGRLLNAQRLMLEATEAIKRARADSHTSIIAFKSDPEKYREFIRTQG